MMNQKMKVVSKLTLSKNERVLVHEAVECVCLQYLDVGGHIWGNDIFGVRNCGQKRNSSKCEPSEMLHRDR